MRPGIAFMAFFVLFFQPNAAFCGSIQDASIPSLVASLEIRGETDFCGENVPLHIPEIRERMEKELLLSLWDRPQVLLWLKRSKRYMTIIEKMLEDAGLPDDLKYVAVAESAFRPHVGSRKGAVGFWQFMRHTGRRYGLVIDRRKDERRNIFKSTEAAIAYLRDLHEKFDSWTLSAAAYNMGETGLMSEIREQETDYYYRLYLPLETQRYIFRILSAKLIMSHPERYGFQLKESDYYPSLDFDRVKIECRSDVPLSIIARAANSYFKRIKDLNPEIRGYDLARGVHTISIPKGASKGFKGRLGSLLAKASQAGNGRFYIVKKGDSLSGIAKRFDIPLPALILWNGLDPRKPIHPGQRIRVYSAAVK